MAKTKSTTYRRKRRLIRAALRFSVNHALRTGIVKKCMSAADPSDSG